MKLWRNWESKPKRSCGGRKWTIKTKKDGYSGAFSVVYKARDTMTGQWVAIKVVRKRELDASQVWEKESRGIHELN